MEFPWNQETNFLVIVHQYDGDVSWSERLKYPFIIYYKDRPDKEPFNAPNKAKAETNTLKFIYEFYDQLPKNLVSVYQYEYKMSHPGSLVDIINGNNFEENYYNSPTVGFYNFNHVFIGKVYQYKSAMLESGWWLKTMEPYFGNIDTYYDFTNGKKGCAQYIVSRDRITSLPKEFYKNMFDWLVQNTIDQEIPPFDPGHKSRISTPIDKNILSNWYTSRYMEWSWQLIYTSYKKTENKKITINGVEILALYGSGSYFINVTSKLIKHCYVDNSFFIPKNTNLNDIFLDIVYGTPKILQLIINKHEFLLKEIRDEDVYIELK